MEDSGPCLLPLVDSLACTHSGSFLQRGQLCLEQLKTKLILVEAGGRKVEEEECLQGTLTHISHTPMGKYVVYCVLMVLSSMR